METDVRIVLCTTPEGKSAMEISRTLIERQLAACVNVIPGITSIYRWRGDITSDTEQMLVIKTRRDRVEKLQETILELHPYELPEVIAVPVTEGSQDYLSWIHENTRS